MHRIDVLALAAAGLTVNHHLKLAAQDALRTDNEDEAERPRRETLGAVFLGERELALAEEDRTEGFPARPVGFILVVGAQDPEQPVSGDGR